MNFWFGSFLGTVLIATPVALTHGVTTGTVRPWVLWLALVVVSAAVTAILWAALAMAKERE